MKKFVMIIMMNFLASSVWAGGVTVGAGFPDPSKDSLSVSADDIPNVYQGFKLHQPSEANSLIIYLGKRASEVKFATMQKGQLNYQMHSFRPEEIANPDVIQGLRKSQSSGKWEKMALDLNLPLAH